MKARIVTLAQIAAEGGRLDPQHYIDNEIGEPVRDSIHKTDDKNPGGKEDMQGAVAAALTYLERLGYNMRGAIMVTSGIPPGMADVRSTMIACGSEPAETLAALCQTATELAGEMGVPIALAAPGGGIDAFLKDQGLPDEAIVAIRDEMERLAKESPVPPVGPDGLL